MEEQYIPHVVIVGGGFAGLYAAKRLKRQPVHVTVLDRRNYHLFQPFLYQVATAGLSPGDVTTPIRSLLRHQRNTTVLLAEAEFINLQQRYVLLTDGVQISYDHLILTTGARHSYFGHAPHPRTQAIEAGVQNTFEEYRTKIEN